MIPPYTHAETVITNLPFPKKQDQSKGGSVPFTERSLWICLPGIGHTHILQHPVYRIKQYVVNQVYTKSICVAAASSVKFQSRNVLQHKFWS